MLIAFRGGVEVWVFHDVIHFVGEHFKFSGKLPDAASIIYYLITFELDFREYETEPILREIHAQHALSTELTQQRQILCYTTHKNPPLFWLRNKSRQRLRHGLSPR